MNLGTVKLIRPIAIFLNCVVLFAYGATFVIFLAGEGVTDMLDAIIPSQKLIVPVLALLAAATPLCSLIALLKTRR